MCSFDRVVVSTSLPKYLCTQYVSKSTFSHLLLLRSKIYAPLHYTNNFLDTNIRLRVASVPIIPTLYQTQTRDEDRDLILSSECEIKSQGCSKESFMTPDSVLCSFAPKF